MRGVEAGILFLNWNLVRRERTNQRLQQQRIRLAAAMRVELDDEKFNCS
jgi:hypothetical protein